MKNNRVIAGIVCDIMALAASSALVYGVSLIHPASAWIVAGLLGLAVSVIGAKRWA